MSPTYDAWLREAKRGIRLYEEQGVSVDRVQADVDEFLAWCRYTGRQPNGAARSDYAAERVRVKNERRN